MVATHCIEVIKLNLNKNANSIFPKKEGNDIFLQISLELAVHEHREKQTHVRS